MQTRYCLCLLLVQLQISRRSQSRPTIRFTVGHLGLSDVTEIGEPEKVSDPEKDRHKIKRRHHENVMDSSFDAELAKQDSLPGVLDVFVRWIDAHRKFAGEMKIAVRAQPKEADHSS